MIRGTRLVIFGKQGSGKGTQCVQLARHYVVPHISTGDMFRAALKSGSEMGNLLDSYMRRGELVPDEVVIRVVADRLSERDARNRGFILDGFPRTGAQAESLDELLASVSMPLDAAVELDVATDVVMNRLSSRRVCQDCGENYSVQHPPRQNWTCDHCGGEVIQRDDDTPDAIGRRLAIYEEQTQPLINWYQKQGLLEVVDGAQPAGVVFEAILAIIERRRMSA